MSEALDQTQSSGHWWMVDTQKAEIDHTGPTLPQGAREGFLEEVTLGEVLQDE